MTPGRNTECEVSRAATGLSGMEMVGSVPVAFRRGNGMLAVVELVNPLGAATPASGFFLKLSPAKEAFLPIFVLGTVMDKAS